MKTRLFALCLAFYAIVSCENEFTDQYFTTDSSAATTEDFALETFSKAFSKVVSQYESVRDLIKNSALEKIDNDSDVFYPFIKNTIIIKDQTLRDLIACELDGDNILDNIEYLLPTLTIYVSDITWLDPDGFCPEKWDITDPYVSVTYRENSGSCSKIFCNGFQVGEIQNNEIIGGPALIIKKNERIVADESFKSGEVSYRFISDSFNGFNNPETKNIRYTGPYSHSWIAGQMPEDHSDSVSTAFLNSLCPDIIYSYNLCQSNPSALPNDYVYYGMTTDSIPGHLRNDVRSKIIRFKISPDSFNAIFDDRNGSDTNFQNVYDTDDDGQGNNAEPSTTKIYSKLWSEGALEIRVRIYTCNSTSSGISTAPEYYYDVKAKDLFTIKPQSIYKERWGSTAFKWYITWKYTLSDRDSSTLEEKWYYPPYSPDLPVWDLKNNSSFLINITECDSGTEMTTTESISAKKANGFTIKLGTDFILGGITTKPEFGWTFSDEETETGSLSIKYKEEDDVLYSGYISYPDKYVQNKLSDDMYEIYSYGTSRFRFTILPYRY